jgi:hypothetical protein
MQFVRTSIVINHSLAFVVVAELPNTYVNTIMSTRHQHVFPHSHTILYIDAP